MIPQSWTPDILSVTTFLYRPNTPPPTVHGCEATSPHWWHSTPLPLPVLLRLQRKETCLDAELEARELTGLEDRVGELDVSKPPPVAPPKGASAEELKMHGITKVSLSRAERAAHARRTSAAARERKGGKPSSLEKF